MFSNPLKQVAEEYLSTNDSSVRERVQQQLVRAGASVVAPLIDALIVRIRELRANVWGKKELESFTKEIERQGMLSEEYLDKLRDQFRDVPDSKDPGMSMASRMYSHEACNDAWKVISQIGESAIRELFSLVNRNDKRVRLAALLALATEENPSRLILNLVLTSVPFHQTPSSDPMESASEWLTLRMLGLSGNRRAKEAIAEFCATNNLNEDEFYDGLFDQAIYLILKS